ncbi:AAA family ATPase [Pseudarthrobacter sp. WHRI 8279]|uniref:ATP-binding protein n=1 Tax=Pseudarthrobacter sp. WHRI 8279 TaxID=3162566 RepID=UPI0032EAAE89
MIQIEQIRIEEFRGIRAIDLELKSKNFVVYGPNGSGKSGVVDAIEFALTGGIGRLSGEGTAGVTIARHAPHVHRRDDPGAAKVMLTVRDLASGESAVLTRSVKDAGNFTLNPDTPAVRKALNEAMGHPELTLSRKELIRFIVAKPGDRAAEVQALLKLDKIEVLRRALKTASSKAATEAKQAEGERKLAEQSFQQHLSLTSLFPSEVLREINARRSTLGLTELTEFSLETDVLSGAASRQATASFNVEVAREDVSALQRAIDDDSSVRTAFGGLDDKLELFRQNPTTIDAIRHRALLDVGLVAVEAAACPLCEVAWESQAALEAHLRERIAATETAQQARTDIMESAKKYREAIRALRDRAEQVLAAARVYGREQLPHEIKAWADGLALVEGGLSSFESVTGEDPAHSADAHAAPQAVSVGLKALATTLNEVPDESASDAARSFLDITKDRWARVRTSRAPAVQAKIVKEAAEGAYEAFCASADEALSTLYQTVESDFSRFYQFVNSDDEGAFRAELVPSSGSLDLSVDFYKLGMFPPIAYHSEGHQDGMGICLYLALVKQLLGDDFRYAVLDDVVMSVDASHRRRFAELLKNEFPKVQFVITTHDEVWARQMRSAGLVTSKGMARFSSWTVDAGPTHSDGDAWNAIEADLEREDVAGAAHKLRRTLESSAADIVESIGGGVTYRSDASYDLSVFLDSIKARHGKLLRMAADAAQSWQNQQQMELVEAQKERRNHALPEHDAESWLVNKLVHNNDWANGSVPDFRPVLDSARAFLALFRCENSNCGSWVSVSGRAGDEDSLRCACQAYNLNLRKKK